MGLGATSIDGLISGLDTTTIINALADARRRPITLLNKRVTQRSQVLTAYQSLSAQVSALGAGAATVAEGKVLQARSVSVSDPASLLVTAGAGAAVGSYSLCVKQLAQAAKLSSASIADSASPLGLSGDFTVNGQTVSLDAGDDLTDLRDAINGAQTGVSASIVTVSDTDHRLILRGLKTGQDNAVALSEAEGGTILSTLGLQELEAARDAIVEVDGFAIQRPDNSVDDAIEGLSFDLLKQDPDATLTVQVRANTQAAVSALQQVVNGYNAIVSTLNAGQSFDSETNTGGVFFGETAILSLEAGLRDQASALVSTLGGGLSVASQIGLSADRYGMLSLNAVTLQEALESDPDGVLSLLTTRGQATDDQIEFVSAGNRTADSGAVGYAVEITQLASRATATSDALVSGLVHEETLTINGRYTVKLEQGLTLQQAADKLNTVFSGNSAGLTAEVADYRLQIRSNFYGSNYAVSIASSLADGAGGTGLGGATAGATQTVYGRNVEGTIGGRKAEGWGQWLTGAEGGVRDLKLKVTGETVGDRGVVKVSQGLASRISNYAGIVTATDGLLTQTSTSLSSGIEAINQDIDRMEQSVSDYVEQLQLKFAALEGLMAKNKTMLQYITGQISSAKGSSVDEDA